MSGNVVEEGQQRRRIWLRISGWVIAALLLLLPAITMQFTDEVNWDESDFSVVGVLIVGAVITFELTMRRTSNVSYRIAMGVALVTALVLIWMNLAAGIIGAEDNPANLMYGGVLVVGIIGAILARFQPGGMARALVATALAQALVGVIALMAGLGSIGPTWPASILGLTGLFAALWLISAALFRIAARKGTPAGSDVG